jgi:hypothetical protein
MKINKKENQSFHMEYKYEDDIRKENEELVKNISEDKKSEFVFKGEHLYYLGEGHAFLHGFFSEYVTQSGVKAWQFVDGLWLIGNDEYEFSNNEFVLIPPPPPKEPIDWSEMSFPIVKSVAAKTLSDELISVKPKK